MRIKHMESKKVEDLLKCLSSIEISIEDNLQNLKDTKQILQELKSELFPKKASMFGRFFKSLTFLKYKYSKK